MLICISRNLTTALRRSCICPSRMSLRNSSLTADPSFVEAAGVETRIGGLSNQLMARDF